MEIVDTTTAPLQWCGGCIHPDVTNFVVPIVDTDSTSMLSYSQRHYDI